MENVKGLCEFQVKRNATRLSRGLLELLEDLQAQQRMNQDELLKIVPPQYHDHIRMANVLTEERMKYLRKRILDNTNDNVRDILADLENFQIEFNFRPERR